MSKAILIIAKENHKCRACKGDINIGDKAVKTKGEDFQDGGYVVTDVYLHEKCWKPHRNQNS